MSVRQYSLMLNIPSRGMGGVPERDIVEWPKSSESEDLAIVDAQGTWDLVCAEFKDSDVLFLGLWESDSQKTRVKWMPGNVCKACYKNIGHTDAPDPSDQKYLDGRRVHVDCYFSELDELITSCPPGGSRRGVRDIGEID
jgi:hypothetical protein